MFYSEEDFKKIRKHIDDVFNSKEYTIRKSTYDWSSRNNWFISIDLSFKNIYYMTPEEKLEAVAYLFTKVSKFSRDKKYNLNFHHVVSRENFKFTFIFQPIVIAAAELLAK